MNRKIISLIILVLIICGAYTISFATETGTVYLDSNYDIVEKGDEVEIVVNLKDSKTAAYNIYLYFDETKWEYVSKIDNTNVESNRILYVWHDVTGGNSPKQGELVKFKFKAKENGLSTFNIDGEFYNSSAQLIKTSFKEKQVQIGKEENILQKEDENTNLEILAIENTLLTPPFDASETKYKTEVPKDTENLNIFAVPENENAKVQIEGGKDLKEGDNIVTVIVTAANGFSTKKYQVIVHRRNEAEQAKYEEEQAEQSQKLDEAYEIEKLSSESEEQIDEENTENTATRSENNSNKINIAIACVIIVVVILISSLFFLRFMIKY